MSEGSAAKVIPLGERLRVHRTERGLSQAQAARELEVARTAYRLWELEAAKPSPDRWRLIARWLGVSISTMLLGEELIDEDDDATAGRIAARGAMDGEHSWDDLGASRAGDFFEQERSTIASETRSGRITAEESRRLSASLDRVLENVRPPGVAAAPGSFRKELVADSSAPEIARAALVAIGAGVDQTVVEHAELLTSELVTNSVERGDGSGPVWLAITLHPERLRVDVADPVTGADRRGLRGERAHWSFAITNELATRWGAGREGQINVTWFEIDLPGDGSTPP